MSIVHYHPKSGKVMSSDGKKLPGYIRAEELVDVRNGHRVFISCEPSSNSGQGVAQALSLVREDPGHEGEPAFMRVEMYQRLGENERKALLQERVSVPKSGPEQQVAALQAELAALKAQKGGK